MELINENEPWVTFCMSTYKRPDFLRKQLISLSQQTFSNFQVIVSDNDPDASGEQVLKELNDKRFSYYHNIENIGMIASFNKSIEKAVTPYIVMLTDDDDVDPGMLNEFKFITASCPGYPIYLGCERANKKKGEVEIFDNESYVFELLHPKHTPIILWSSCLLDRKVVQQFGGVPDFGSPHFADHALLLLCGKNKGGVFINKMYGSLASHDQNFSKNHFDLYYIGCVGFYKFITSNFKKNSFEKNNINALEQHLHTWFIKNYFSLRKYFTYKKPNSQTLKEIDHFSKSILSLAFMKTVKPRFRIKQLIFLFKKPIFFIKYHH
ncbi:MAG: glycosyltransferase family 2 protein [Bacteroidota bacterium]|nr:glycosyltransferase family 2 protein [Bacteroidota bacterium]